MSMGYSSEHIAKVQVLLMVMVYWGRRHGKNNYNVEMILHKKVTEEYKII